MNTIQDLNNFGNTSVNFTDDRTPDVIFDKPSSVNGSISVNFTSGGAPNHQVPVGINIREFIRPDVALPTYTIDLSAASGSATLTWPSLPVGITASTPSANVYRLSGFTLVSQWNTVKSPTVVINPAYSGTFQYTATITWSSTETMTWTVSVSAENTGIISLARSSTTYSNYQETLVVGSPLITDLSASGTGTYTLTVVPNPTSAVSLMSSNGRQVWTVSQTLNDPDSPDNGNYASSAMIPSGGYVALGKPSSDTPFNGEINIYTGSAGTYTYQTTLSPSGEPSGTLNLGSGVAFDSTASTLASPSNGHGYTFVFTRSGSSWTQQAKINTGLTKGSGGSNGIVLSSDGNTLVECQTGDVFNTYGKAKVYTRSGSTWSEQNSNLTTTDAFNTDFFGDNIVASSDANTVAISASYYNKRFQTSSINGGSISTAQNKFGTASLRLQNTLSTTQFMLLPEVLFRGFYQWGDHPNALDGCIEMWFRADVINAGYLFRMPGGSTDDGLLISSGILSYRKSNAVRISGSTVISTNTWNHVALVFKANGDHKLFLNGTQEGSIWAGANLGDYPYFGVGNPMIIGATKNSSGQFSNGFNGYIDELRISKGIVRYDSTFTPSATAFTEDQYTLGLAHFNEANGSTTTSGLGFTANAGAVYVFTRSGSTWTQQAKLESPTPTASDRFGEHINMLSDGNTIYVGSGTNTYVFTRSGTTWTLSQTLAFKISNKGLDSSGIYAVTTGGAVYKKVLGSWNQWGTMTANTIVGVVAATPSILNYTAANLLVNQSTTVGTSWNAGAKTLTLTGNRSEVNADLDTVKFTVTNGFTSNFILTYTVTTPAAITDDRDQNVIRSF